MLVSIEAYIRKSKMKVLIADDHALFRDGLIYMLQDLADSVSILEAGNTKDALELAVRQQDLDLILLDQFMPGLDGINALHLFREKMPEIPVVIVSASGEQEDIRSALKKGASGYIPKSSSSQAMIEALRSVLQGNIYVPDHIELTSQKSNPVAPLDFTSARTRLTHALSPRQSEVLSLICEGLKNSEIANSLNMSEGTVKIHITAIFKQLKVTSRIQALLLAEKEGFRLSGS